MEAYSNHFCFSEKRSTHWTQLRWSTGINGKLVLQKHNGSETIWITLDVQTFRVTIIFKHFYRGCLPLEGGKLKKCFQWPGTQTENPWPPKTWAALTTGLLHPNKLYSLRICKWVEHPAGHSGNLGLIPGSTGSTQQLARATLITENSKFKVIPSLHTK